MNNKLTNMLPKVTMWVLMGVSVVITVLFFLFIDKGDTLAANPEFIEPQFTGLFMGINYFMVALGVLVTAFVVLAGFGASFKENPKKAAMSLLPVLLMALLLIVTWFLGSGEKMDIIGYEGTDNVGFWPQCTDMICYSVYTLVSITILCILGGVIYKKLQK